MQSIMDAPHEFDSINNASLDRLRKQATPQLFNMANAQGNMFRKNLHLLNNQQNKTRPAPFKGKRTTNKQ